MPPPKDLPGFYFDEEKNRYFPIRGPIPGNKRPSSSSSPCTPMRRGTADHKARRIGGVVRVKRLNSVNLLRARELSGTHIVSCKRTRTLNKSTRSSKSLYLCLYQVGTVAEHYGYGFECRAEPAWHPLDESKSWQDCAPANIWCLGGSLHPSHISCIKKINKDFSNSDADIFSSHQELVTTLGSGLSGGSVQILNLCEPLDTSINNFDLNRRISMIALFDCTVWTVESNRHGTHAAVGTNLGAALINLETKKKSWVYCTKSDIFAQQFDYSGNILLCGLRNGAVVQVDTRQKPQGSFEHQAGPSRRQSSHRSFHVLQQDKKTRIAARGIHQSQTKLNVCDACYMPSAVCSLALLQSDDSYILGSSMDGSINLFDRRLLCRGAVQSYTGHQNSHTILQLGVNPSETLVMSGGEDGFVRIWNIKSSELIFEENVTNSIVTTIC